MTDTLIFSTDIALTLRGTGVGCMAGPAKQDEQIRLAKARDML